MSSNTNHINLSNYEEYFILYMDNELDAKEKGEVENFISLHPHLAEELEMLMSTKLPVDTVSFYNKEDLHSSSMKLSIVDEALLLYVDDELNASQKALVEEKISNNKDYALQHSLLVQTKLDTAEVVFHPNKKELYRHSERVIYFPVWMRVAVAVVILLLGSLFFLMNSNKATIDGSFVATKPSVNQPAKKNIVPEQKPVFIPQQKEEPLLVKAPEVKKNDAALLKAAPVGDKKLIKATDDVAMQQENDLPTKMEVIKLEVSHFATQPNINDVAVNKTIAHTPVTSPVTASYNKQNDPAVAAVTDGDFEMEKKTRSKGFFRKVSRFIERNTGIGTVNTDNELLIGAVALKLK